MSAESVDTLDGRRARRDRNRAAVVDAVIELLQETGVSPATEVVAERAGVSVSSVFRYFDNIDDLMQVTLARYFETFADLFDLPTMGVGPLPDRIRHLVQRRVELYSTIAPIARHARARATSEPRIADTLLMIRHGFRHQIVTHFAGEFEAMTATRAHDLAGVVDVITSFESWDLLQTAHERSDLQIRRAWTGALEQLFG